MIKSAAVMPDTGDRSRELAGLFVMDVILLNSDATNKASHRRFQRVSFDRPCFSLDGVVDLKPRTRNLNAP
jgi:hypothetical protein